MEEGSPKLGIRETGSLWASCLHMATRLQDLEPVVHALQEKREKFEHIPPLLDHLIEDLIVNYEETVEMTVNARTMCAGIYPGYTLYGHADKLPEGIDNDGDNDTSTGDTQASG